MAKYMLGNLEVTKEEFNREVYKGVEGTIVLNEPFFLDEVLNSFFPPKDEEESKSIKGVTIDMSELKGENAFKNLKFRNEKLSQEEKDKVNQLRTSITGVFCNEPYDFKLPVTGVVNHTGGTVFEKVQDSTIPNKNIDPFYVVDIKNISKVDLKRNDLDEMLDYVFRGQYEDKKDPLDAYNAITGHSTRHHKFPEKSLEEKVKESQETYGTKINLPEFPNDYLTYLVNMYNGDFNRAEKFTVDTPKFGKKETEGKLHYELSWEFIEEMAKRMANNKSDKYPLYNWKKPIDVEDLKDAINRHHIEVMKGNYQDGNEILGHVVSYACNAMMLWEQLRDKIK